MTLNICLILAVRITLVAIFLPFSALDKLLNFSGAVAQAQQAVRLRGVAVALIVAGLLVEILMSLGIITGVADRACALVLAAYCGITALVWKQFWKPGDFWTSNTGQGRTLFWDFLKNFALGAGFLLITVGTGAAGVEQFLQHPFASSHPYRLQQNLNDRER